MLVVNKRLFWQLLCQRSLAVLNSFVNWWGRSISLNSSIDLIPMTRLLSFTVLGFTQSQLKAMQERMESSQLKTYNLTESDLVTVHLRYLMGGRSNVQNEVVCCFIFPERPGALMKFLDSFSPCWNISLFHYCVQGETGTNVLLVGIQVPRSEMAEFHDYTVVNNDNDFQLLMR